MYLCKYRIKASQYHKGKIIISCYFKMTFIVYNGDIHSSNNKVKQNVIHFFSIILFFMSQYFYIRVIDIRT